MKDKVSPQIYKGDPKPCIAPHAMVPSAMGSNGEFWVLANYTQNKCVHDLPPLCGIFVCSSSLSDCN